MKAELLKAALKVIPDPALLVNMVSRRVRQLNDGSAKLSTSRFPQRARALRSAGLNVLRTAGVRQPIQPPGRRLAIKARENARKLQAFQSGRPQTRFPSSLHGIG